jgi:predicted N-acetyltransferase YhbS
MEHVELRRIDEAGMTLEMDAAIRHLLCACFPNDAAVFARVRAWHDCMPTYSQVASDAASVVGHVGVVIREITCGGERVTVAGVQSLAVAPEFRGAGLSRRLMSEAMDEAKRRGIEFGLLFCVPGLGRFYASLGWQRTHQPSIMLDEHGRRTPIRAYNIAMFKPLGSTPFPGGPIDIRGRDW